MATILDANGVAILDALSSAIADELGITLQWIYPRGKNRLGMGLRIR